MTELTATQSTVTRSFWIISGLALLWNLVGVAAYLSSVSLSPEAIEAMSEAEQALHNNVPTWVVSAYAIAVFSGALGCIFLLMRKSIAYPIFIVSLIAIVAQMGYSLFMSSTIDVYGPTAAILPLLVTAVGAYLIWFSSNAKKQGILN